MPYTLTFTGHGSSWCKVNNTTVTFPYTLKNGDVITFGNDSDQDQYFTVNGERLTSGSSALSNTNIAIVGVVASPVREDEYTINYTEIVTKQVDLTTLTGWANLSDGEHIITIKAKADGYRDSRASEGVQVTKGSTGETWVLNETISLPSADFTANFTSNNKQYIRIKVYTPELVYAASSVDTYAVYTIKPATWYDEAYRTLTFATAPTGDLLTWLQANGTKQGGG